jgi:hypothetical protein
MDPINSLNNISDNDSSNAVTPGGFLDDLPSLGAFQDNAFALPSFFSVMPSMPPMPPMPPMLSMPLFNDNIINYDDFIVCPHCRLYLNLSSLEEHMEYHENIQPDEPQTSGTFSSLNVPVTELPSFSVFSSLRHLAPLSPISQITGYQENVESHDLYHHQNSLSSYSSQVDQESLRSEPHTPTPLTLRPPNPDIDGISFRRLLQMPPRVSRLDNVNNILSDLQNILYAQYSHDDDFDDYDFNIRLADRLGRVEVGIDNIDNVSKLLSSEEVPDDSLCVICLDKTNENNKITRQLICKHMYCDDCICKWLQTNKKCPTCNIDLEDMIDNKQGTVVA